MSAVPATGDFPVLTVLVLLPFVGALVALLVPARRPEYVRIVGIVTTVAVAAMALSLFFDFDPGGPLFQYGDRYTWIPELGVQWLMGADGISIVLVVVAAILFPLALLQSGDIERPKAFVCWLLMLEGANLGVFLALDLVPFFLFFELTLLPMYFLILGWGHDRRVYAATKFFLYTMAASAFLFVGILVLAILHQHDTGVFTFDAPSLIDWASRPGSMSATTARLLFCCFVAAFVVKVPLWPFHTWLPDAHTEAPTAGSVNLAGVALKMGGYGLLRFAIPLFPAAAVDLAPVLLTLAVVSIVYGAIVSAMQGNLKRLVAYSSVSHMGFVVLGAFALTVIGVQGSVFVMVSHGFLTPALFMLLGMLYQRRHTYEIDAYGGLWKSVPVLSGLFLATAFASLGLPGFSGFVGEFTALLGTFLSHRWWAVVATTGTILAAVYLLWAFQRAFTGEPRGAAAGLGDVGVREVASVVPLLLLSLGLGLFPKPVLDRTKPAADAIVAVLEDRTDYRAPEPEAPAATPETPEEETGG